LVEIESPGRVGASARSAVLATRKGLVSRCWVHVGATVGLGDRIVAVVRREEVRVLALFDRAQLERARSTPRAVVSFGEPSRYRLHASVLRIGTWEAATEDAASEDTENETPCSIRVLLEIPSLPPAVLQPGLEISVDLRCD
jgi:multidrug resistance efflux pump